MPESQTRIDPAVEKQLLEEWPSCIGAMVTLSLMRFDVETSDPDATSPDRVFHPISAENLKILGRQEITRADISAFVESQFRFSERYFGSFDGPESTVEYHMQLAALSLVYLGRDEKVISNFIAVFAPLLRPNSWDIGFRDRVARTFADDVFHYLYEVLQIDGSGGHQPFDWYGNLNEFSGYRRREWLASIGLKPLQRPGFPPQRVWLAHERTQPFASDAAYRRFLTRYYQKQGYLGRPTLDES